MERENLDNPYERNVLITGGCGFLGYNLILRLVSDQTVTSICVVDNCITSSRARLETFVRRHHNVTFIYGDICKEEVVNKIKETCRSLHEIYHLAGIASPPFYKQFPLDTLDVGYIGTKNMLELCRHYGESCKIMYSSTSEVYGDALEHPQKESYRGNVNVYGERACYDESKRIGETLVYTYQRLYGVNARIIRIFNTYGPFMSICDGRIVTEIMRAVLLGKPLTIHGNGLQTRSLTYVDDTISMMLRVMQSDYSGPVNVGSDDEITINELVARACKMYKYHFKREPNIKILHNEIDIDDPKIRRPCLNLNKQVVGHKSKVSLDDGLLKTLLYFKRAIDNPIM